jgi:hypothetical protein
MPHPFATRALLFALRSEPVVVRTPHEFANLVREAAAVFGGEIR